MFNIIWEFIINLLESFLFAVICNAKFTKRQYHYHTAGDYEEKSVNNNLL